MKLIKELWQYREMIINLVKRDLKSRYKGSVLGFLWMFLNPLFQLCVYTIVFSVIMRMDIEKFYLFLFVALVPWIFISTCLTGGTTVIFGQQDMVKKIYFPREVIPISYVTSAFINMLFSFLIVFLAVLVSGFGFYWKGMLYLPIIMLFEYLLALGIAFAISAATVYFRDLEQIVSVVMMAWIYITPIMYTIDYVPEQYRYFMMLNPMTPIVEVYHQILYYRMVPTPNYLLLAGTTGCLVFAIGFLLFTVLERNFAEEM